MIGEDGFGEALVKEEGSETPYDRYVSFPAATRWYVRVVRWLSGWAWNRDVQDTMEALNGSIRERNRAVGIATLRKLQLAILEELFREKQAKISRLQNSYTAKRRVLYEDLRKENPIRDTESLIQSIDALARRAEAYRYRTGKRWPHSDGTVQGVPGDKPNVETGCGW